MRMITFTKIFLTLAVVVILGLLAALACELGAPNVPIIGLALGFFLLIMGWMWRTER